jgi:hypothetical protein
VAGCFVKCLLESLGCGLGKLQRKPEVIEMYAQEAKKVIKRRPSHGSRRVTTLYIYQGRILISKQIKEKEN